tara:strand:- start:8 stop:376 length:369 start_codon:yes stop_codon:yes gene_type:complete
LKRDAKLKQDAKQDHEQADPKQKKQDVEQDKGKKDHDKGEKAKDGDDDQDVVVNEVQPNEKEQEHVVEENETLATICAKFGILHPEVVYDYEPNKAIFYEPLEDQGVKKDCRTSDSSLQCEC